VLAAFTISQVEQHALRIGVVTYTDTATVVADLCTFTNYTQFVDRMNSVTAQTSSSTNLRR
jgi:hypothetical protein